jgi:leukotriene-A4 hydrolase
VNPSGADQFSLVKATYSAKVTVTEPNVNIYMSGVSKTPAGVKSGANTVFLFEQTNPIQSYLIAIIGGAVQKKSFPGTAIPIGVITEASDLDNFFEILSDLPLFLQGAIDWVSYPYEWAEYNIVILPPTFPFGGMENPLLTFASPSIMTADKAQVFVATHEIAHSWSGNLVTNQNWSNFWLNEGFTVYTERNVSQRLHDLSFFNQEALIGDDGLTTDIETFHKFSPTYSSLTPQMNGRNPDDSFSTIPYEKGFQLLYSVEECIEGVKPNEGKMIMQLFLKEYFTRYAKMSIDVPMMQDQM